LDEFVSSYLGKFVRTVCHMCFMLQSTGLKPKASPTKVLRQEAQPAMPLLKQASAKKGAKPSPLRPTAAKAKAKAKGRELGEEDTLAEDTLATALFGPEELEEGAGGALDDAKEAQHVLTIFPNYIS
jgi:hypothetical protein